MALTPDAATALPLVFEAPRRGTPPRHLADLDPAARREAVQALGERAFRADQLARAYFTGSGLSSLPSTRRDDLVAALLPDLLSPVREVTTDGGATRKMLWRAHDGVLIESVLMRYRADETADRDDRTTVCVSSQAGCGMACPFCATGQGGLTRNLSAAEIVHQVVAAQRALDAGAVPGGAGRVGNVVFMGMGEPLANYARVIAAVRRLTDPQPHGLGLSQRHLTVSTVGLVPAMRRLAEERLQVRLAVSLHAPDDALRDTLVPVNTRWPVREVLAAAWHYAGVTGRRVSIEYALIRGVNDQPERAEHLAALLAGRRVHVNLIPLNPTPGSAWDASPRRDQDAFVRRLRARGVATTVRDTRGRDIDGACGQLAARPVEVSA
ncbi:MAG TPA: 23S rRNA (adenine(2503)-C(2))-methyltransferase RlmN [Mycobacteriales bacterium]